MLCLGLLGYKFTLIFVLVMFQYSIKYRKKVKSMVQPNPSGLGYVGLDPYDGLIFSNPAMMGHIEKTSRPVYTLILETSIEHYSLNTPN